jgi:predicted nucleotidyltransferase
MSSTAAFLLGQTRSAVLGTLFLHPESSLHVRELARLTGASPGSLHRDLRALADLGLLVRQEVGRQVHYRANPDSPIFAELSGLLRKTAGVVDVLRDALAPVADKIDRAFIYGSIARGTEHAHSDVDVMIVGEVDFGEAIVALAQAQGKLQREINPTVLSQIEFGKKLKQRDGFVSQVWKGPKLWLVGDDTRRTK